MGFVYLIQFIVAYFKTLFDKAGVIGWACLGIVAVTYIAFPLFMTWNVFIFSCGIFIGFILMPLEFPKPK